MFALVIERDPFRLDNLPYSVLTWVQVVGGFAAVGVGLWLLTVLVGWLTGTRRPRAWSFPSRLAGVLVCGLVIALLPATLQVIWNALQWTSAASRPSQAAPWYQPYQDQLRLRPAILLFQVGASLALAMVLVPLLANVPRLRWRRIWR